MLGGGALIAELRPQLFLVVERDDEIAAHLLEKVAVFDAVQQLHAIRFPRNFGVSQLVPLAGVLIQSVHPIGDQRLCGRVFRCLVVPGLDCGDVVAVAQKIVWINIARDLHKRLQSRRRERNRVIRPCARDVKAGGRRRRNHRHRTCRAFEKDTAIVFASTINFPHELLPLTFVVDCVQPKRPPLWSTSILYPSGSATKKNRASDLPSCLSSRSCPGDNCSRSKRACSAARSSTTTAR